MGRADVTISEKYRRIVEAYQVEQVIVDVGNPVIFVGTYHTYQVVVK